MGIFDLLLFSAFVFGALWATGRADQFSTASATLLAWIGMSRFGWGGWQWDWEQAAWYAGLAVLLASSVTLVKRRGYSGLRAKPAIDYIALLGWGIVQQGLLLGFMAQISPLLAVVLFSAFHWPNKTLVAVTAIGSAASIGIMVYFGEPAILVAGLSHALVSFYLRDILDIDMSVGKGYRDG